MLFALVAVVVFATPASAARAAPWRWKVVVGGREIVEAGTQEEVTLYCPSGYRPVSLEWGPFGGGYDLELQAEYVDYTGNWGHLKVFNHNSYNRTLETTLHCVNGDDIGDITTASVLAGRVGARSGGFVDCPNGWGPLSAGVDWEGYSTGRRIDFSSPTQVGWYATGYGPEPNTHLYIEVHCVADSVLGGAEMVQAQVGGMAGQAPTATVNCPAGKRVFNTGAFQYPVGGDVDPFSTTQGSTRAASQLQIPGEPGQFSAVANLLNTTTFLVARAWCVPYSVPVLTVTSHPSGPQISRAISYSFTATEPVGEDLRYQCLLDYRFSHAMDVPCQPGVTNTVSAIGDGYHSLDIWVRNDSNQMDIEVDYFTVDATAPDTIIDSGPTGPVSSTSATFAFSSDAGASFACSLDGGGFTACTSPKGYTELSQGSHAFAVRATDTAGNTDSTAATRTWKIDTVAPPDPTISTHPTDPANNATAAFGLTDDEAGVTFSCSIDGGAFSACTSGQTYTGLTEGSHTFRVRAADAATNASSPTTFTWTVDTVAPQTTITSGPTGTVTVHSATFRFTASEQRSTFVCSLDGGAFRTCASPRTYTGVKSGPHVFKVKARDRAGNIDGTAAVRRWTVK